MKAMVTLNVKEQKRLLVLNEVLADCAGSLTEAEDWRLQEERSKI